MKKDDFLKKIAENIYDMKQLNINYKYSYDKFERQEIFKISRKISRYNFELVDESRKKINEDDLFKNFFHSLEFFNSYKIYDYFKNHAEKIKLVRSNKVYLDDAELDYDLRDEKPKFYLHLPKTRLTITNQLGFAHEMGHIPEIDTPRHSFLEYVETLPIFFEYVTAISMYQCDALDNFSLERLNMIIDDSINIQDLYKRCEVKNNVQSLFFKQEFAECYKFLESTDFALQLIDLSLTNKERIIKEVEEIIDGKSLIDVQEDLNIDTSGCKRLLKEYKRIGSDHYE
mgnify:CR=1 FL=1